MSRVTAPLLSFDAAGQIAKTQVYSRWRGLPYVRRYVIPANPQSPAQTETRTVFTWLQAVYQLSPGDFRAPWQTFVLGRPLTDRNAWTKSNLRLLRPLDDLTGITMSPGAKGGLSAVVTPDMGSTTATIAFTTPPVLPTGWTIVGGTAVAIRAQDPHSGTLYEIFSDTDGGPQCGDDPPAPTDTPAPEITGLTASQSYMIAGWLIYQRSSNGCDVAYGPAVATAHSTTA